MTTELDTAIAWQLVRIGELTARQFFHVDTYGEVLEAVASLDEQSARIILDRLVNLERSTA